MSPHHTRTMALTLALALLWSVSACGDQDAGQSGPPANEEDVGPDILEGDAEPDVGDPEPEPDTPASEDVPEVDLEEEPACVPGDEVCDGEDNDCDGEVDEAADVAPLVQDDTDHCGACGAKCDFQGAEGLCREGACALLGCLPLHLDLDGDATNGCEVKAGEPRSLMLSRETPERVVGFDPWFAVLDGEAVWLYLASTRELIDVQVLPGALDAAYDEARSLLVVAGGESLSVLDVTDAGLRWRGWYEAPGNEMTRVALNGDVAYVANNFNSIGNSRAFVFDLSDPSAPVVAHREATLRGTTDLAMLDGEHLVTVSVSTGLSVYDVRRPTQPRLISFDHYQTFPSRDLKIDRERRLAYVASQYDGINIFSLADLEHVERIGQITEVTSGQEVVALHVDGFDLWTADYSRLRRYDMTNINAPRRLALQSLTGVGAMVPVGDQLLMTSFRSWNFPMTRYNINGGGVHSADLGEDGATLSREPVYEGESQGSLERIYAMNGHLMLVDRNGQVFLYEPHGEGRDFELGEVVYQQYMGFWDAQIVGDELHAVTSTYSGRFHTSDYTIMTLEDPQFGLTELVRQDFDCIQSGVIPYNLRVIGDRAYVICGGFDLRHVEQIDLSDPSAPRHIGRLQRTLPIFHIEATDGQLITSTERRVLNRTAARLDGYRLPVRDLETPNWSFIPEGLTAGLTRHGPVLYHRTDSGLDLLDLSVADGYVPLDPPALPGPLTLSAPPPVVVGDHTIVSTNAGAVMMAAQSEDFSTPGSAGQLTLMPLFPSSAVLVEGAVLALEKRRLVIIPLE